MVSTYLTHSLCVCIVRRNFTMTAQEEECLDTATGITTREWIGLDVCFSSEKEMISAASLASEIYGSGRLA